MVDVLATALGALIVLVLFIVAGLFVPKQNSTKKAYVTLVGYTDQYNYALQVANVLNANVELTSCSDNEFGGVLPAEKTGFVCFITRYDFRDYEYMRTEQKHALFTLDDGTNIYNIVAKVRPGEDYWEMEGRVTLQIISLKLPGVTSFGSSPIQEETYNLLVEMGIPEW
jgi:hypothetical protein